MAADKKAYEAHAGHTVHITRGDGSDMVVTDSDPYVTAKPDEQRDLDAHPFIKPVSAEAAGSKKSEGAR